MRSAAATVIALLCVAIGTGGGGVAEADTAAQGQLGFSLTAVGSPRWFTLDPERGQRVQAELVLHNLTSRPEEIALAGTDALTAAAGGFAFSTAERATHTGAWLDLSRTLVRLAASARAVVPFTVTVPRNAGAGQHYAGITAVNLAQLRALAARRRHRQFSVLTVTRAGIAVQVDLRGRPVRRLSCTGASLQVSPPGPYLDLHLVNSGNQLIPRTAVDLTLLGRDKKRVLQSRTELGSFLTDTKLGYELPWRGSLGAGTYELVGDVRPEGAPAIPVAQTLRVTEGTVRSIQHQGGLPVLEANGIPFFIYVILAVAAALILALGYALARAKR